MIMFELVCQYLRIPPLKNIFYTIFTVQRGADWVYELKDFCWTIPSLMEEKIDVHQVLWAFV